MSAAAYVDGRADRALALDNRGLAYGDGVFRTLLVADGAVMNLDDHLEAIARDAARLQLDAPDAAALRAESAALAAGQVRAVLKWLLVRRSDGRGYRAASRAATRIVMRSAAPQYPATLWTQGIVAAHAHLRLAVQPALAGIKHLNRLEQVLAAAELDEGIDELLMCDHDGRLIGGLRSNLFWVQQGRLATPILDRCGIAGTMRARIMRTATAMDLTVDKVDAAASVLERADEVFVCNALIGIWPLRELGARRWLAPGPLTARLQAALHHPRLS